jgi:hypothetical protein
VKRKSTIRVARRFKAASAWDSIVSKARQEIGRIEAGVAPAIKKIEEARDRALEKVFATLLAESFREEAGVSPTIRKVDIWEQTADYETYKVFKCDVELEVPSSVVNRDGEIDVVTEDEIKSALGDWAYTAKAKIQVGKRVTKVKMEDARIHI